MKIVTKVSSVSTNTHGGHDPASIQDLASIIIFRLTASTPGHWDQLLLIGSFYSRKYSTCVELLNCLEYNDTCTQWVAIVKENFIIKIFMYQWSILNLRQFDLLIIIIKIDNVTIQNLSNGHILLMFVHMIISNTWLFPEYQCHLLHWLAS